MTRCAGFAVSLLVQKAALFVEPPTPTMLTAKDGENVDNAGAIFDQGSALTNLC
jgi:hypothetical protein